MLTRSRAVTAAFVVTLTLASCTSKHAPKVAASSAATSTTSSSSAVASSPSATASPTASTPKSAAATNAQPAAAAAALLKTAGVKADAAGTVSYTMVMTIPVPGQADARITATGVSAMRPPIRSRISMKMAIGGQDLVIEALMTPTAMYMRFPPQMSAALGGKAWVKLAFADLAKSGGLDLSQLMKQSQQSSPTAYLKTLAAAGDVRKVGTETIGGTVTTHYSSTISPAALAGAYTGKLGSQVKSLLNGLGTEPVLLDIWLAADGLPRRMHEVMTMKAGKSDIAIDFLKFGAKLDVTVPPASQTTDFATLMRKKAAAK